MGRLLHLRGDPHQETQLLMPWYVTGRMDSADRLLVDAHLATCAACRDDLAAERRLSEAIRDLPLAADEQWDRMAAQLSVRPPLRRVWWQRPIGTAGFIAAQAAVVVLAVGIFASQRAIAPATAPVPAYRALGEPSAAATGNVLVMFAPDTPEQTMRAAFAATRGRLIGGPTAAGAYLLAVAPADRARALTDLRARRAVVLAQPVDAPTP